MNKKYICKLKIFDYFILLFGVNVLFIGLSYWFYNGNFDFWLMPYSILSDTINQFGSNYFGSLFYSLAMFLSGLVMFYFAYNYYKNNHKGKIGFINLISFLGAGGFFIAALSPHDLRPDPHALGSALAVASLWVLTTHFLFELREKLNRLEYYILQMILQVPIFAYAFSYVFILKPEDATLQKISFITLVFVLLYSSYKVCKK